MEEFKKLAEKHPLALFGGLGVVGMFILLYFSGGTNNTVTTLQSQQNTLQSQQMQLQAQQNIASIQAQPQLAALQDQYGLQSATIAAQQNVANNQSATQLQEFELATLLQKNETDAQSAAFNANLNNQYQMANLQTKAAETINGQNTAAASNQSAVTAQLYQTLMPQVLGAQLQIAQDQYATQQQNIEAELQAQQDRNTSPSATMSGIGGLLGGVAAAIPALAML